MEEFVAPIDIEKVDAAKGVQHWSLAENRGRQFTKDELAWFPGRVEQLRWLGYNKYHVARIIASDTGRSIDSIRYQCFHSMKLWPPVAKEHSLFQIGENVRLTKEEEMTMTAQEFRKVLENEWTPVENSTLWRERVRYLQILPSDVRPTRRGMAEFCAPSLPGRSLLAVDNHIGVKGWGPTTRHNNSKPKRRRKVRRAVKFTPAGPLAGKVKLERTFKCPGCGLKSEVI